ncbi:MAG: repeat containing protein [Cyanobacteria bacterium RYN_339]|nr:repeat containing protein [Cyanobacteria bacterium RYN_339]
MRRLLLVALVVGLVGCKVTPAAVKPSTPSKPKVTATNAPALLTRTVVQSGQPADLIGKVKLLSDAGAAVISNNSSGIISDHGTGLVSNNGGGLIGKVKRGLLAAADEALLADAAIQVRDAAGKLLVDAAGKPLGAVSDGQGGYHLQAVLPDENLVLTVAIRTGGQLNAILPRERPQDLPIDTAATLGATYVLDRYVKGSAEVYARLPRAEADALHADLEDARALLPAGPPTYQAADLAAAVDQLRAKAPKLEQRLQRIQALLLVGQKNLGAGLDATKVVLTAPTGLLGDGQGGLLIAETFGGRIRRLTPEGKLVVVAGGAGTGAVDEGDAAQVSLAGPSGLALGPDGAVYFTDVYNNRVRKLAGLGSAKPTITTVAGNGEHLQGAVGGKATLTSLMNPGAIAVGPDGTVYVGEVPEMAQRDVPGGRLLAVAPDGTITQIALPGDLPPQAQVLGVAADASGGLWVYAGTERAKGQVLFRQGLGPWRAMATNLSAVGTSRMTLDPAGGVYVAEEERQSVFHLAADGTRAEVAGSGTVGFSGDGGPALGAALNRPAGMWKAPDGSLYLADSGNGLVRKIDAAGVITTVAGAYGLTQQGEGSAIPINGPVGLAIDPQGRLVMSEAASSVIKRLDGTALSVIAGTTRGFAGDGGPATAARLNTPVGIAYDAGTLYVADGLNFRIRAIAPDGTITTVAGGGSGLAPVARLTAAKRISMQHVTGLVIGPDHLPYWLDEGSNQVLRLTAEGQVEVLAGGLDRLDGDAGDGGPAAQALLAKPLGLAFGPDGDLYIADTGNMRVRRIAMADPQRKITTFAGLPKSALVGALLGGKLPDDQGKPAVQASIFAPAGLCFGPDGALYLTELGTAKLGTLFAGNEAAVKSLPRVGSRIRRVTPDGKITTIAGDGTGILDVGQDDALNNPTGLLLDAQGRLIIADSGNNQVKVLPKGTF